jgi:hypothetical protein
MSRVKDMPDVDECAGAEKMVTKFSANKKASFVAGLIL